MASLKSTTITVRIDNETKEQLEKIAAITRRSKSFLAADAIREFVASNSLFLAAPEPVKAEKPKPKAANEEYIGEPLPFVLPSLATTPATVSPAAVTDALTQRMEQADKSLSEGVEAHDIDAQFEEWKKRQQLDWEAA